MSINNALIATFAIVLLLFEVILPFIRYQLYNTMYIYTKEISKGCSFKGNNL